MQGGTDARLGRIRIVIPHPGLEEVAEDVEPFGSAGMDLQKFQKLLDRLRRTAIQVHVRDEEPRHDAIWEAGAAAGCGAGAAALASISSIFWMMTGFSGASDLNGPTLPVATAPMRSTT